MTGSRRSTLLDRHPALAGVLPALLGVYVVIASVAPLLYGKYFAVALLLAVVFAIVTQGMPPRIVWAWPLALSLLGLFGLLVGLVHNNPGVRSSVIFYLVEPVLIGSAFALAARESRWDRTIVTILDLAAIAVAVAGGLLWVLQLEGLYVPTWIYGPHFAVDAYNLRTNYQGYNALVFLLGYAAVRVINSPVLANQGAWWRRLLVGAAVLSGVILSGRQILLLMAPLALLMAALAVSTRFDWSRLRPRGRVLQGLWVGGALLVVAGAVVVSQTDPKSLEAAYGGDSGGVRSQQMAALMDGWQTSPIWGHGIGATIPGMVRHEAYPWIFETSYQQLLFNFGLIGAVVLVGWAGWIVKHLGAAALRRDRLAQASLAGFVTTLLAVATNPYVFHIDGIWMVMLPFGMAVSRASNARTKDESVGSEPTTGATTTSAWQASGTAGAVSGRVVWLLIAFKNMAEVDDYVDHLRSLPGAERFDVAICDNTPTSAGPALSRHRGNPDVTITARPDNPGYLDGALAARAAYLSQHDEANVDWWALSNTDLEVRSTSVPTDLDHFDADRALVLAPRITEGHDQTDKNPHVLVRRSNRRLALNRWAAVTTPTAWVYAALHAWRLSRSARRGSQRHDAEAWARSYPAGTTFYSPYGAVMFFSRGFFGAGGLPTGAPLMTEEYFIAEAAIDNDAPVVYVPSIHFHHTAHTTTGSKISWSRARHTRNSFLAIHRHARSRRQESGVARS